MTRDLVHVAAPQSAANLKWNEGGTCDLGLEKTLAVLAEAGDPASVWLNATYGPVNPPRAADKGPLGQLLSQRNNSFLAHGSVPIAVDKGRDLRRIVYEFLDRHCRDSTCNANSETRAAGAADLDRLLEVAQFHRCPWGKAEYPKASTP